METIHVTFDELHQSMAPIHISSGPEPMSMTPGQFSSGLIPNQVHATNYVLPTDKDLELLFQPMFDEYFEVTRVYEPVPSATAVNVQVVPPVGPTIKDTLITQATLHPLVNPVTEEPSSAQSSSGDVSIAEPNQANQPPDHLKKMVQRSPFLIIIVGNPSVCHLEQSNGLSDTSTKLSFTWSSANPKDYHMALTAYADAEHADSRHRRILHGSAQFYREKLVASSKKVKRKPLPFRQQRLNTLQCLVVVLKSYGCDLSLQKDLD
ncbi:hypothetical protein Tco_1362561 [Tanacetum coccineum]